MGPVCSEEGVEKARDRHGGQSMAVPPAEISTDLLTPLGAYLRLRGEGRASFLLESVEQGRLGRHSFIGSGSRVVSFEEAEALGEPVVGYLAYDYVARLEPTVPLPEAGGDLPESRFVVADTLVRFDHGSGTATVLAGDRDEIARRLEQELVHNEHKVRSPSAETDSARASPTRAEYEAGVRRIQEHIRAGDAFQVVLSQRAERPTSASALELYRALRRVNPSPYLFLLELDGLALVGSSPETLVKCENRRASLNPIAGTTHPGEGDAERLLASEKDRAEHVMLVDLGRNDLSRVCRAGSVRVERFLEPERFSHVTHLVSEVAGALRDGVDAVRPPPRLFPRRHRFRRSEDPRDADRQRARRSSPRAVRGRSRLRPARRSRSTPASRSGRSSSTTGSRGSRRAPGSWQTPIRAPSTRSA